MVTPSDVNWDDHRSHPGLLAELSFVSWRDKPRGSEDIGQHRAVHHAVKILLWPQKEWPGPAFPRYIRNFYRNRTWPSQLAPLVTSNSAGIPNIVWQIFRDVSHLLHRLQGSALKWATTTSAHIHHVTRCSFDFMLPSRSSWELRSSGLLRSE